MAGRESEQSVIRRRIGALAESAALASDIILYGPRGNGKTVMLDWALQQARARRIRTISLSAAESDEKWTLLNELSLLPNWLGEVLGRFRDASEASAGVQGHDTPGPSLAGMLRRRTRLGPLLLSLDEAHKVDASFGRDLLNVVQRLQRERRPVMLMLAGTPDLLRHLSSLEASFWERNTRLPIGRIGRKASADAIRIPLEEGGRSITAAALEATAGESDGYPYFVQLLGEALWKACSDPSTPVSLADVDRITPYFRRTQYLYYDDRQEELERAGLAQVAASVAESFASHEWRTGRQVDRTIRNCLERLGRPAGEDSVRRACDRMRDLGFIWRVFHRSAPCYEPGIPSLMSYVARVAGDGTAAA